MRLGLEAERLHLRPWTPGDTSWHRDLVGERGGETPTAEADAEVIAGVVGAQSAHGVVPSVVVRKVDGEILGYCGLVIGRATVHEPELAYELFQHAHGHGYATEAAFAVIAAAKQTGRCRLWSTVRTAFGASEAPLWMTGGRGLTSRSGQIVVRPTADQEEASWKSQVLAEFDRPDVLDMVVYGSGRLSGFYW